MSRLRNHRSAFNADPTFIARLETECISRCPMQGVSPVDVRR